MAVKLLGVPYDTHSSFLRGAAAAPAAVREALHNGSANWTTEFGVDIHPDAGVWSDIGDVDFAGIDERPDVEAAMAAVRHRASDAIGDGSPLVSIGGDHLVAWPLVQAITARHDDVTILHFDAHPDLYDELDGDRFSHACPFARIMEEGNVARLVQFGIRTMTAHQRDQAERFGVEVVPFGTWDGTLPAVAGPVYVSIDVDALDPAFAPGTSHHEPGGMSTRMLLDALHQLATSADGQSANLVGADIVEINPRRDINNMTAMVGAKLVREMIGLLAGAQGISRSV